MNQQVSDKSAQCSECVISVKKSNIIGNCEPFNNKDWIVKGPQEPPTFNQKARKVTAALLWTSNLQEDQHQQAVKLFQRHIFYWKWRSWTSRGIALPVPIRCVLVVQYRHDNLRERFLRQNKMKLPRWYRRWRRVWSGCGQRLMAVQPNAVWAL